MYCRPVGQVIFANWLATTSAMSGKSPIHSSARATYDKMNPAERQRLLETLGGLAGLQQGPKDAFPDGTRYEYDCKVKRTFEVAPSGRRFPVALVCGKFQRDPATPVSHKTAR